MYVDETKNKAIYDIKKLLMLSGIAIAFILSGALFCIFLSILVRIGDTILGW
jgi:hypothetical protein